LRKMDDRTFGPGDGVIALGCHNPLNQSRSIRIPAHRGDQEFLAFLVLTPDAVHFQANRKARGAACMAPRAE